MTEDLEMTGDDYNVALFTFFITYILFEVRFPIRIFGVLPWQAHLLLPFNFDGTTLLAMETTCHFHNTN